MGTCCKHTDGRLCASFGHAPLARFGKEMSSCTVHMRNYAPCGEYFLYACSGYHAVGFTRGEFKRKREWKETF